MKTLIIMAALFATTVCYAQQTNKIPNQLIDRIIGKWQINTVVGKPNAKNKTNAHTDEKTPGPPTEIIFKRDMRYFSNSNNGSGLDSGSFRVNENHRRLYLQSDISTKQPTEWDVFIHKNQLTLQADSLKNKNHFQYLYRFVSY